MTKNGDGWLAFFALLVPIGTFLATVSVGWTIAALGAVGIFTGAIVEIRHAIDKLKP